MNVATSLGRRSASASPVRGAGDRRHSGTSALQLLISGAWARVHELRPVMNENPRGRTMTLPFTPGEFFDVFSAYNRALWPFATALWIYALAVVVRFALGRASGRSIAVLLTIEWAWTAVAYHAAFFAPINPAAWLFAFLFLVEGGLIAWFGVVHRRMQFSTGSSPRAALAWVVIVYALAYPLLARAGGHAFPAMPTFGVPCPTTILTIGFLLTGDARMPRAIAAIPLFWAVVAGSAALTLGVMPDLMLWASGGVYAAHLVRTARPRVHA